MCTIHMMIRMTLALRLVSLPGHRRHPPDEVAKAVAVVAMPQGR